MIELYKKSGKRLVENVVHIVLHSLLLHPSMTCEQDKLFDAAADASVFGMMRSADALTAPMAVRAKLEKIKNLTGSTSAADIYTAACSSPEIKNLLFSVSSVLKADDHSPWYKKDNSKKDKDNSQSNELSGNGDPTNDTVRLIKPSVKDADEWKGYLSECKEIAASSKYHGSEHGNMFAEIKKPDRFSRFSYREYIRRFAIDEMICEDPETLDMAMYSWKIENLHDIPIIEFSECRENCSVSDIIIAMDMSGSCSGFERIFTILSERGASAQSAPRAAMIYKGEIVRAMKYAAKLKPEYNVCLVSRKKQLNALSKQGIAYAAILDETADWKKLK